MALRCNLETVIYGNTIGFFFAYGKPARLVLVETYETERAGQTLLDSISIGHMDLPEVLLESIRASTSSVRSAAHVRYAEVLIDEDKIHVDSIGDFRVYLDQGDSFDVILEQTLQYADPQIVPAALYRLRHVHPSIPVSWISDKGIGHRRKKTYSSFRLPVNIYIASCAFHRYIEPRQLLDEFRAESVKSSQVDGQGAWLKLELY